MYRKDCNAEGQAGGLKLHRKQNECNDMIDAKSQLC